MVPYMWMSVHPRVGFRLGGRPRSCTNRYIYSRGGRSCQGNCFLDKLLTKAEKATSVGVHQWEYVATGAEGV